MPAEEAAVAGQDRVHALKVARGCDLGVFEREALVAQGDLEHLFRQRQDPQKPHELGGEEAFASASPRSRLGTMVADHPEGGGTYMASDGACFGEGQGACRRDRILSLQEYVQNHVRIKQHGKRFAVPKAGFEVRRHRAARFAGLRVP